MTFIVPLSASKCRGLILLQLRFIQITQLRYGKHCSGFADKSWDSTWVIHIVGTPTTEDISLALEDHFNNFVLIRAW